MNKRKMIVIISVLLVFSLFSIQAVGLKASDTIQNAKISTNIDEAPTIYRVYAPTEAYEVEWGYTKLSYRFLTKNEIGGEVDIEFDFDDGTTDVYEDVGGWLYMNHKFSSAGTYQVKARYVGHSSWSEPFEFPVTDHCDLAIKNIYTEPPSFGKTDIIDIKATIINEGSVSTTQDTTLYIYEGYDNYDHNNPIKQISTGILSPGEEATITLEDFNWYGDEYTHSFWASVDEVSGEIDWRELGYSDYTNNVGSGHFTAPKYKFKITPIINSALAEIFEKIPQLRNLIKI